MYLGGNEGSVLEKAFHSSANAAPLYAGVPQNIKDLKAKASKQFTIAKDNKDEQGIKDACEKLQALLPIYIERIQDIIAALTHPESPDVGMKFNRLMSRTNCKIYIDPALNHPTKDNAIYSSYSYAKHNKGLANELGVNHYRLDEILALADTVAHEVIHILQLMSSEALKLSPFNPDTRVIVHPEHWILLDKFCEQDAYTKQGWLSYLISRSYPEQREATKAQLVSVYDVEMAINDHPNLSDALVHLALGALSKDMDLDKPGRIFEDHYQDCSVKNYKDGMGMRQHEKEAGHIFVRLSPEDFWAIGNHGIGPNSLGRNGLHEDFLQQNLLSEKNEEIIRNICRDHNIPPLEECMTLQEYLAQQKNPTPPLEINPAYIQASQLLQPSLAL